MGRYRKRPLEVEAEQYWPGQHTPGVEIDDGCYGGPDGYPHVHTIHKGQIAEIEPGDWIVIEPDGIHAYPIKPDIFEATYEAVD